MAKRNAATSELDALRDAIGVVHHDLAYRAGAIAQAAFRLAQHQALHAEVTTAMTVQPGINAALKGLGIAWNEPMSVAGRALPELLRELCAQIADLAHRVEHLTVESATASAAPDGGASNG